MVKYELQGIEPFNEVYYTSCFNLSLFTVIRYLKGSIFSCIANDIFIYKLTESVQGLLLEIEKRQVLPESQIARFNCIKVVKKNGSYGSDIVNVIIDSILKGYIIILPIDGYYYKHPYHDLFYQKEHHYQPIVIYGFDNEIRVFKTVEVNGFQWDTANCCYKHELSYQNAITCHEGVINNMRYLGPTLFKFSRKRPKRLINDNPEFYKSKVIDNLKQNKKKIFKGLENIKILAENLERFDIDKTTVFNNKVAAFANQYKMTKILGEEGDYLPYLSEIIENWKAIEHLIYKSEIKGAFEKEKLNIKLNKLYDLELCLYEGLFNSI